MSSLTGDIDPVGGFTLVKWTRGFGLDSSCADGFPRRMRACLDEIYLTSGHSFLLFLQYTCTCILSFAYPYRVINFLHVLGTISQI